MLLCNKCVSVNKFLKNISSKFFVKTSLRKVVISITLRSLLKIQNYFVFQSICLLDSVSGQKPVLNISKYRYNLGSKSLTYSCRVSLRSRNLIRFVHFLNFIIFPEMKRRYIVCSSDVNNSDHYTFSVITTNIFTKLDEFYFKWNQPIVLNVIFNRGVSRSAIFDYLDYNLKN